MFSVVSTSEIAVSFSFGPTDIEGINASDELATLEQDDIVGNEEDMKGNCELLTLHS